MDRRTTISAAALFALLLVAFAAVPANAQTDPTDGTDGSAGTAGAHPTQVRRFFWMNAERSTASARAARTATSRMRTTVAALRSQAIDFGVLAETEPDQRADFRRLAGPTYRLVTGHNRLDNVVFYRPSAFRLLDTESMRTRYDHGQVIHTAIPVLQDRASGRVVAVIPVHNPKLTAARHWRQVDLDREVARATRLQRQHPDWQVVVAGDFNGEWTPACAFTHAGLLSPLTGPGRCRHVGLIIDQMFATSGLDPRGYRAMRTSATDHHRAYRVKLTL